MLLIGALFFVASSIQGVLGYGFAVLSSPILVQIDPALVPVLLSLLALPLAIKIFRREKSEIRWSPMKHLLVGRIVGGPLGLLCLNYLEQRVLSTIVGLIVLFAGLASYFGWTLERNSRNSFNHNFNDKNCQYSAENCRILSENCRNFRNSCDYSFRPNE